MIRLAQRMQALPTSVIRKMTRLAIEHQAVNMAQGLPDIATAPAVLEAAVRAVRDGHNQYTVTWGIAPLRTAIAEGLARDYGLTYDPATEVTVTVGVSEGLLLAALSLFEAGDEVIVPEPFHDSYLPALTMAGARPVFVPLRRPDYPLDADRLRAAITPRTRAVIVNTPHNPTGRVFTRDELTAVADLCQAHDLLAITDEIYDRLTYDGAPHVPLATIDGMRERTLTLAGVGKSFAVTGWRIGYLCAPPAITEAVRRLHDYTTICAPAPLQHAAVTALRLPPSFAADVRAEFDQRRARMMGILDRFGMRARPPQGAFYVMADYRAWLTADQIPDDHAFGTFLVGQVGVAAVPGCSFYADAATARGTMRWAFAKTAATFDALEDRFARFADTHGLTMRPAPAP